MQNMHRDSEDQMCSYLNMATKGSGQISNYNLFMHLQIQLVSCLQLVWKGQRRIKHFVTFV